MSAARPPEGAKAPLGGSEPNAVGERGGEVSAARPPEGAKVGTAAVEPSDGLDMAAVRLLALEQDVVRNIVSLRQSQDLFDDLSDEPAHWALAQQAEAAAKPPPYRSAQPVIDRPFEDAAWFNAIQWPFQHWQSSRFSDGRFGVWYGSDCARTTVFETAYHWVHGLLADAGFDKEPVLAERKLYNVALNATLWDLRGACTPGQGVLHPRDYASAQQLGARMHAQGHPGLLVPSVRCPQGHNVAVFNPGVLSRARLQCQLSYRWQDGTVVVEKTPGRAWLRLGLDALG
ncbi:MAG: RES family NAD+ phosphorylase [Rhodoferax sp.]